MVATATTTVSAVKDFFQGLVTTADSTATPLMNILPAIPALGNSYDWVVKTTENASSGTLADGGTFSAAGNAVYADATISYASSLKETVYALTGLARDFARQGNFDPMMEEMKSALAAHQRAVEAALIVDITAAIDSGGSYAGLTRATVKMASYEADLSAAALALSNMATMDETLRADPIDTDMNANIIVSAVDRRNEYLAVAVGTGAGDARITQAAANAVDAGLTQASTSYNGKKWYDISTMTSGTVLEFNPAYVKRMVSRPIQIDLLAKTTDADTFAITSNEKLIVTNPRKCGKLISS